MKTEELKVGLYYRISYRKELPAIYSTAAEIKPVAGIGKLVKINDGRFGWHSFYVENVGVVYAASRSISACKGALPTRPEETPVVVEVPAAEIEKLVQLGFDDKLRQATVQGILDSLVGLGINCSANENWSGINIPFVGLANLKTLINTLYAKSVERDMEELDGWH